MPAREPGRDSGVVRVIVDADVLDSHHRPHTRRVVDSQNVMEKIADHQVAGSLTPVFENGLSAKYQKFPLFTTSGLETFF